MEQLPFHQWIRKASQSLHALHLCRKSLIYFLAKGHCEVLKRINSTREVYIRDIGENEEAMFGHLPAVLGSRANYSVKSKNYSTVAGLSSKSFENLVIQFPKLLDRIQRFIHIDP